MVHSICGCHSSVSSQNFSMSIQHGSGMPSTDLPPSSSGTNLQSPSLCQWAAWLAYCFVAMLLYCPVGGGGGSCLTVTCYFAAVCLAAKRFCQGGAWSVRLYVTLPATRGLLGLYAAALLLFCLPFKVCPVSMLSR